MNYGVEHPPQPTVIPTLRVSPPNGISIGSPVFAQLTRVLNRQTYTQTTLRITSVAIGSSEHYYIFSQSQVSNRGTAIAGSVFVTAGIDEFRAQKFAMSCTKSMLQSE